MDYRPHFRAAVVMKLLLLIFFAFDLLLLILSCLIPEVWPSAFLVGWSAHGILIISIVLLIGR